MMKVIIHKKSCDIPAKHNSRHKNYEYYRRDIVPFGLGERCRVSVYEIPPGKSAYPYHYHVKNEEVFYIISGKGVLKTPLGEKNVERGEFLFFPANENGAHKLTNNSKTEMLIYIDFDTISDFEAAVYPDSGKIGLWGKNINRLYKIGNETDYYEGE